MSGSGALMASPAAAAAAAVVTTAAAGRPCGERRHGTLLGPCPRRSPPLNQSLLPALSDRPSAGICQHQSGAAATGRSAARPSLPTGRRAHNGQSVGTGGPIRPGAIAGTEQSLGLPLRPRLRLDNRGQPRRYINSTTGLDYSNRADWTNGTSHGGN